MVCKHGHKLTEETYFRNSQGDMVCRPCKQAAGRRYHHAHRDRLLLAMKSRYMENANSVLEDRRQYHAEHPEVARRSVANRRARKRNQFIETVDPQTVYEMHGGRCGICEEFIDGDFHVDHIKPLSKGGMHGYINVQPAHPLCNLRKGNSR